MKVELASFDLNQEAHHLRTSSSGAFNFLIRNDKASIATSPPDALAWRRNLRQAGRLPRGLTRTISKLQTAVMCNCTYRHKAGPSSFKAVVNWEPGDHILSTTSTVTDYGVAGGLRGAPLRDCLA